MSVCMLRQTQGCEVMGTDWFLSGFNERVRRVTLEPKEQQTHTPPHHINNTRPQSPKPGVKLELFYLIMGGGDLPDMFWVPVPD